MSRRLLIFLATALAAAAWTQQALLKSEAASSLAKSNAGGDASVLPDDSGTLREFTPEAVPADSPDSPHPVERAAARGILLAAKTEISGSSGRLVRTRLMQTSLQPRRVRVVDEWTRDAARGWLCHCRNLYLADQIIVRMREGTTAAEFEATLRKAGAGQAQPIAEYLYTARLDRSDIDAVPDALTALAAPGMAVAEAEPDGVGFGGGIPNDPSFATQWGHHNTGQSSGAVDADVDAPEFWDIIESAPGVVIAVLDSGLNTTHPDLQNLAWRNPGEIAGDGIDNDGSGRIDDVTGWDFVNSDNNPVDDHGHGSNVTGIICATRNNGTGIAGMISGVQIMICKILNSSNTGTTSSLIAATSYARLRGAKIMNLSLQNYPYNSSLDTEFTACRTAGVLLSICAGNQGVNNDTTPNYPSSFTQDNIIAVGNHDRRDERWSGSFNPSNYGAVSVDIFAPGRSILSPVLGSSYSEYTGTSQAAPYVTAVAAAIKYLNPSWQAAQIKASLLTTRVTKPAYSGICVTGGRLNAVAAAGHAVRQLQNNDSDGDAFSNLYEYLAGTRTDSGLSFPRVTSSTSGGSFRIAVSQVVRPDASFAVERSGDLNTWETEGVTLFSTGTLLEAGVPLEGASRSYLRFRPVP